VVPVILRPPFASLSPVPTFVGEIQCSTVFMAHTPFSASLGRAALTLPFSWSGVVHIYSLFGFVASFSGSPFFSSGPFRLLSATHSFHFFEWQEWFHPFPFCFFSNEVATGTPPPERRETLCREHAVFLRMVRGHFPFCLGQSLTEWRELFLNPLQKPCVEFLLHPVSQLLSLPLTV